MVSTELCTSLLASAGRVCALPAGHPEQRHRNGEISWTDEMAAAETVADLEATLGHRCSTHAIRACTICTPAGVA
jgi:hypothetical protein